MYKETNYTVWDLKIESYFPCKVSELDEDDVACMEIRKQDKEWLLVNKCIKEFK